MALVFIPILMIANVVPPDLEDLLECEYFNSGWSHSELEVRVITTDLTTAGFCQKQNKVY